MTTAALFPRQQHALASLPREEQAEMPYQTTLITSVQEFEKIQAPWDAFLAEMGIENFCLGHQWLSTCLKHFPPEQLLILIVKDTTGRWLGVAPLQINPGKTGYTHRLLKHVQFIGTQPTMFDWMTFPILQEVDELAVLQQMATVLKSFHWDVMELFFMPNHPQAEKLCQAFKQSPASSIKETMPIPYLPITENAVDYAKNRRKKTRLDVNRFHNRILKMYQEPPVLEFLDDSPETATLLHYFFDGHIHYWGQRGVKSEFKRFPQLYQFYLDLLAKNPSIDASRRDELPTQTPQLLFSIFKIKGEPVCFQLGFWQGSRYLSHITHYEESFKHCSPGTLHMDALIFKTIEAQGQAFEFGRGDEPYKKFWTEHKKPLWNLRMFRSPVSWAIWQIDSMLKRLAGKAIL